MSNWFDGFAKRAARSASTASAAVESSAVDDAGLSRRQVLARGAVITGVAWTAPALLAARPAFAGASMCPNREGDFFKICDDADRTEVCCPFESDGCFELDNGRLVCQTELGGLCGNRGNGQCAGNTARCDQPANDQSQDLGICGGSGARCDNEEVCLFDNCSTDGRCGGAGAPCASDEQCSQPDPNDPEIFVCDFDTPPNPAVPGKTGTCREVV